MKSRFDIVIAGGGMVGLSAALALRAQDTTGRFGITVVDAGAPPEFSSQSDVGLRVSALSLGTVERLRQVGVWDTIAAARAGRYESMRVWDARSFVDGPETLRFNAADFALSDLGYIVENELVRVALLEQLQRSTHVQLRFGTKIESVEQRSDGIDLALTHGDTLPSDLLIAADGANSPIRRGAGIATKSWRYPQSALVTHVTSTESHARTAWQRFLPDGPIALLPLADGRCSVVWTAAPDRVAELVAMDDAALSRELTRAADGVLGDLIVAGPRGSFPLRAQHAVRYVDAGLVLVGDAAHSVHPLAGQGANLGFADAFELAAVVTAAAQQGEYPGDLPTLRRYERRRRGENALMLHFIDSLNRLFSTRSGMLASLRRRGMWAFNRSGPIRRHAVRVALGIDV